MMKWNKPFLFLGIFQYNFGLMPYRKPINVVVGAPIPVQKVEKPSLEEILALRDKYVEALEKLYEEHNPKLGDPNVRLVVN